MNRKKFNQKNKFDTNASLINLGTFTHNCGKYAILKLSTDDIPYPNAYVFDKNKKQIGKVDEIFGPQNDVYVSIDSDKQYDEYFIYSNKLIPKNRFLERSETEKKKEAEDKKKRKIEGPKRSGGDRKFNNDKRSSGHGRFDKDRKFGGNRRSGGDRKFGGDRRR